MKLLSVGIPCYNSMAYMDKAIDSVLVCEEDVEIIIVNDGSKDETDRIGKEYAEKYDLDRKLIWFVYTIGLSDEVKAAVNAATEECGFEEVVWIPCNGVITTHGGPKAFGLAGFSK